LFWGEPLDGVRERIERLTTLSRELGREHAPLEFGLRVTTVVRDTTEEAWAPAEAKVADMAKASGTPPQNPHRRTAVGQQRLLDLASRGEVLDDNLYTTPGRFGGGGAATTWLVGSARDVATSLQKYAGLGSPTPCSRTLRTCARSSVRAASCCRSCADERSPDGPPAQSAMNVLMSFAFVAAFEPEVGIAPGRHRTLRTE
jgi:hypothetical protein